MQCGSLRSRVLYMPGCKALCTEQSQIQILMESLTLKKCEPSICWATRSFSSQKLWIKGVAMVRNVNCKTALASKPKQLPSTQEDGILKSLFETFFKHEAMQALVEVEPLQHRKPSIDEEQTCFSSDNESACLPYTIAVLRDAQRHL